MVDAADAVPVKVVSTSSVKEKVSVPPKKSGSGSSHLQSNPRTALYMKEERHPHPHQHQHIHQH